MSKTAGLLLGLALGSAQAGEAATDEARLALGRQVFTEQAQPACALCHSLQDAGAAGAIGPDLDQLKPSPERVMAAVRGGVGVMPAFAASLSAEQIEAVAHYVARVTQP
ncbi:c-type cytochrome [Pseudomonas lalucatii]|uniref:SorU family sulfite dehydrogenase c-type cytochrome subunit n=1 Tax=Pseudomonas lalucatii TaxID=1424203 RepID=UPI001BCF5C01|nr:cytochrome c [Pseudomonas lalucatii]